MSGKPALFREREGKKVIELAKKAGARSVEFRYGDVTAIVRLSDNKPDELVASEEQITL